jgi:hypothetical protein
VCNHFPQPKLRFRTFIPWKYFLFYKKGKSADGGPVARTAHNRLFRVCFQKRFKAYAGRKHPLDLPFEIGKAYPDKCLVIIIPLKKIRNCFLLFGSGAD